MPFVLDNLIHEYISIRDTPCFLAQPRALRSILGIFNLPLLLFCHCAPRLATARSKAVQTAAARNAAAWTATHAAAARTAAQCDRRLGCRGLQRPVQARARAEALWVELGPPLMAHRPLGPYRTAAAQRPPPRQTAAVPTVLCAL